MIGIKQSVGLSGHFNIKKFSRRGILLGEWDFDNLITNNGMNILVGDRGTAGGAEKINDYCSVGTGSTDPAFGDTTLDVFFAARGASVCDYTIDATTPWDLHFSCKYEFNIGTFDNTNITEIGVGPTNLGDNLFCHQKILDEGGLPTTITVLVDESLLVTWTYTCSINPNTQNYTLTINEDGTPVNYDVSQSPINVLGNTNISTCGTSYPNGSRGFSNYSGMWLFTTYCSIFDVQNPLYAFETNTPYGSTAVIPQSDSSRVQAGVTQRDAYVNDSWELTGSCTFTPLQANFTTGIGRIFFFTTYGDCQIVFPTTKIPKVEGKSLTINVKTTWDRV